MCREGLDLRDLPDDLSDTAFDVLAGRAVVCDILLNFPGITEPYSSYDNLVQEYFYGYKDLNGWGGYNEFFASLNEFSEYIILPYEFQQFYE